MTGFTPVVEKRAFEGMPDDPMLARSADVAQMLDYWNLTDDLIEGADAVRGRRETYLPRFSDETNEEYQNRHNQTKYTNVYGDIIESLASKPFEEEISLPDSDNNRPPEQLLSFTENVDGTGNNLTAYAAHLFYNAINSAVHWIHVDFPKADPSIRTVADAKQRGARPYWSHVLGRNVLEPRSEIINGEEVLTYMRVYEPGKPDRVRIYERLPNGSVVWQLYEKKDVDRDYNGKRTFFHEIDSGTITIGVIPFVWFATGRRDGKTFKFFPPMRAAADLQKELYQEESGLKYKQVMGAYSMLAANGISPVRDGAGNPMPIKVGPSRVLYGPRDGDGNAGSWEYVEPSAQLLEHLAKGVTTTIQNLRELGRQPLTAQSGNLTVITTAVAAGKAKSAVGAWALGLKNALENAMVLTCKFANLNYDPVVNVFTEFDNVLDDGKDVEALNSMRDREEPDLSQETYWEEMKRRKVLSPEFDADRERKRLLAEIPGDGEDRRDIDETPNPAVQSDDQTAQQLDD